MSSPTPEPEILRPRINRGTDLFSDRNLDVLSHLLDDFLRVPGTQIRFGLDGIIGLIPGVGDIIGAMASWIIILAAWMRGVPRVTLARMLANVAIETVVGAVPVIGDAFDIAWKANRKNFALLERAIGAVPTYGADGSVRYAAGSASTVDGRAAATAAAPDWQAQSSLRSSTLPQQKKHVFSDWLFLLALVCGMLLLLAIPLVILAWLAGHFFAMGAHHA